MIMMIVARKVTTLSLLNGIALVVYEFGSLFGVVHSAAIREIFITYL